MAEKYTGPEKVAILLISLGDKLASKVLQQLDERDIQTIGSYIACLGNVSTEAIDEVAGEFYQGITSGESGVVSGGKDYIRKILLNINDPAKVDEVMDNISGPDEESIGRGFETIRRLDTQTISNFLMNEHPQTAAIVLSHLDPRHAAAVLKELPERNRGDIVLRIATLDRVVSSALKELDEALQIEFRAGVVGEGKEIGGVNSAAEILNQMDNTAENSILAEVEEKDVDLAEGIRQLMFVFEDLVNVDDRGIQAILKEVSSEELLLALKTASDTLKEKLFKNMSERAATMLKEDLEAMGPVRVSEIVKAQQAVIRIAKRLEEEGKIMIGGGGGEEFV